jgi:hypothetical protein
VDAAGFGEMIGEAGKDGLYIRYIQVIQATSKQHGKVETYSILPAEELETENHPRKKKKNLSRF